MIREARAVWGLDAPVAVMAGQIQQESAWRPGVCSSFACGLAQFTPATAQWISGAYSATLGANQPFSPDWAIRALAQYDYDLYHGISDVARDCDRWAMALSGYNGGPGWLTKDRALCRAAAGCDPTLWWSNVELHTSRSPAAMVENRGYPRRILLRYQYTYELWGRSITCPLSPSSSSALPASL